MPGNNKIFEFWLIVNLALKPLSDISDSSDPRSPQLRLPDVDTPSPFKKDKPDKPG